MEYPSQRQLFDLAGNMKRLKLHSIVNWRGKQWVIDEFVDLSTVRLRLNDGSLIRKVAIAELETTVLPTDRTPIQLVSEYEWQRVQRIYEAIEPLTVMQRMKRADVELAAERLDCSVPAIYVYLKIWKKYGRVSAFVRKPRSDVGKSRMDPLVQAVIDEHIQTHHKTEERPDIAETHTLIRAACAKLGLHMPSLTPIMAAIKRLPEKERAKARYGGKLAKERYEPYLGSFPGADYPQAVYQIDHTPADVILVDEERRKPIGRATLTIVLDVCTRMIAGFCISLEDPGAINAALALSHAILPKEEWLKKHDIDAPWPIWGKPRKVLADNAKEFRGNALTRGCREYGITLENRPKGQPQYGGHVERAFRTFMGATQRLKGTTFSNVAKKLKYDSEGKAILTIAEYEHWFGLFLAYRYHHKRQRGIDHPPINLFNKLILGTDTTPPIGLPEPIADKRRLLMDFLPYTTRTVQQDGVVFERIHYWEDVLRKWIGAIDPDKPNVSRCFVFAYDPRDLSFLYFMDPQSNEYIPIPYRDKSRPPISYWELKSVQRLISAEPLRQSNEEMIFLGIDKMRDLEQMAEGETKKVRRTLARRKGWETAQRSAAKNNRDAVAPSVRPENTRVRTTSSQSSLGVDDDNDIPMPTFDDI